MRALSSRALLVWLNAPVIRNFIGYFLSWQGAWTSASVLREAVYAGVCALLVWLSAPVIRNMFSPFQVMNTSFGSWRFVVSPKTKL